MYAPITFSYPLPPISKSRTKKKFSASYLRNGIYVPRMKYLVVWLKIAPNDGTCRSCGNVIHEGDVYGRHDMRGSYCRDCIVVPFWARHFKVEFSLKHKSKPNSAGIRRYTIVTSLSKIKQYEQELRAEGRRVKIEEVAI